MVNVATNAVPQVQGQETSAAAANSAGKEAGFDFQGLINALVAVEQGGKVVQDGSANTGEVSTASNNGGDEQTDGKTPSDAQMLAMAQAGGMIVQAVPTPVDAKTQQIPDVPSASNKVGAVDANSAKSAQKMPGTGTLQMPAQAAINPKTVDDGAITQDLPENGKSAGQDVVGATADAASKVDAVVDAAVKSATTVASAASVTTATSDTSVSAGSDDSDVKSVSEPNIHKGEVGKNSLLSKSAKTDVELKDVSVPIQKVSVEWRFDGNSRTPYFAVADSESFEASLSGKTADNTSDSTTSPLDGASTTAASSANATLAVAGKSIPPRQVDVPTNASEDQQAKVIIDSVVREVKLHKSLGKDDLVVKLNPPELGSLSVRITQDASGLSSQISAGNDTVRGLLQAHLPTLMDAFSGAGVKMQSVSITFDSSFGALAQDTAQGNMQGSMNSNAQGNMAGGSGQSQQFSSHGRTSFDGYTLTDSTPIAYQAAEYAAHSWLA